jgi:hypothetical protein
MGKSAPAWTPNHHLATGRLAWLAASPVLRRRAAPWWTILFRVLGSTSRQSTTGTGLARDVTTDVTSGRLASYSVPVDRVAERLSPAEVAALRERGQLPDWFFDAVEHERKAFLRSLK